MFDQLEEIHRRPKPFEFYTARELWTDAYTSKQMLKYHLDGGVDISSRNIKFIDRSAKWIVSRFDIKAGKSVADFGCGPGLYTERLARTGASVTGIDFSENSLEYARAKANRESLRIQYVTVNYLEYQTEETFDLILMIFCDFCALSPDQRKTLLVKFKNLLKPGGSILLDAYSLKAFNQKEEGSSCAPNLQNRFWSQDEYFGFLAAFKYGDVKVTLDKYTIIEKTRTRRIYNWLQYYDKESIRKEFAGCGLTIEKYLANVAGDDFNAEGTEFAVIAKSGGK